MSNNSTNVASYLILNSLSTGSKYGLEIIENISNRTGGHYIMKKPTLYSALTRMEKKGLVSSSYWETSDMGGKRHYYTITNSGRKELELLENDFQNATFDDFDEEPEISQKENLQQEESPSIVGWQDSIFNITAEKPVEQKEEKVEQSSDALENQIDIFTFQAEQKQNQPAQTQQRMEYYQSILEQQPSYFEESSSASEQKDLSEKKDDGVFLQENDRLTVAQEQQNQRLYDNSNDLKRYRKRKSFAENQIEMSVDYETEEDREIQRERIESLKSTLLNLKQSQNEQILGKSETSNDSNLSQPQKSLQQPQPAEIQEQENLDDAVFITSRYNENEIPVQKKITPPNLEISINDDNLPAPKRDANLEPTYKDMMAKLFERKKEKEKLREENLKATQTQQNAQIQAEQKNQANNSLKEQNPQKAYESGNYSDLDSFVDYGSLQKYYAERGISFKEYKKTTVQHNHNTNFLQFISSVVLLLLSGVGCAAIFGIVASVNLLNPSTNFLFYTAPCAFLLYVIFTFARFKLYASKKASFTYNSVVNWAVFILSLVVILVINIICGMQYEIISKFLTAILVPSYAVLLAFPCNYYIKKFLYKKYAR